MFYDCLKKYYFFDMIANVFMRKEHENDEAFLKRGSRSSNNNIYLNVNSHIFWNERAYFNNYISNYVEILLATSFGVTIYEALIRKEKNRDDRNEKQ